jgi:hypothetical protein
MTRKCINAALISIIMIVGCNKKDLSKNPGYEGSLIEQARTYFNNEILSGPSSASGAQNQRQKNPKLPVWEKAYISKSGGLEIVNVPLKYEKSIGLKSQKDGQSSPLEQRSLLVFIKDRLGKFKSNVTTYIPGEYLKNNTNNLSAIIINEDWYGNSQSKFAVKDGKLRKFKQSSTSIAARVESQTCTIIDWYNCNVDNYGGYYNCTYLYTEVVSCWDESLDPYDPDAGGGGGGGAAPGDPASCTLPDMEAGVSTSSQTIGVGVGDIDAITKYKNPDWVILTAPTYKLISHENGKVQLADPQINKWVWLELSHRSITMEGFTIGGSISYTQGTGTPSFVAGTPNVIYGGMSVSFAVTFSPASVTCGNVTIGIPAYSKNFTSNAIWAANP